MLASITAHGLATYTGTPQNMAGLGTLNFVYGCNGAGKTTISRLIAMTTLPAGCEVSWTDNLPLQAFVYNRDFVHRNLGQSHEIKGIFTLGETTVETQNKIEELQKRIADLEQEIAQKQRTLRGVDGKGGKRAELETLRNGLGETCWVVMRAREGVFSEAFVGLKKSKERFRDRVLDELKTNKAALQTLDYLQERASTLFRAGEEAEPLVSLPDFSALFPLEQDALLSKVIVGRSDVDVAALIARLGMSDWVREGQDYLNRSDGICPFCQQPEPVNLKDELTAYFDETFTQDTTNLNSLVSRYITLATALHHAIAAIVETPSRHIDQAGLASLLKDLNVIWRTNTDLLRKKQKEPSHKVDLVSSSTAAQSVIALLTQTNAALTKHNNLIKNRAIEQARLKSEVWRFLLDDDLKSALQAYTGKRDGLNAAIKSLEDQITAKEQDKKTAQSELRALEQQVTSVEPTVNRMNELLESCDFTGFKLTNANKAGFYQLIRDDGSLVDDTLSEGERSFVAFLYFYHLLQGSESESGTVGDRVAVFDDPVSSLDSNVLFAVSSLIRELYDPIISDSGSLKQLIVLTHNVYFHKEVTCHPPKKAGMKFWVVKKRKGRSFIEAKAKNPISSSYELLWQELQDSHLSPVTIQNTMRRILEQYFRMNGNLDVGKLDGTFTGKDRQLFRSLFSWVNAGSHDVMDDLYASSDDFTIEHYQEVFKKVFNKTDQIGHYNMMMKLGD